MSPPLIVLRPDDAARVASLHAAATGNDGWPVQDYRTMLSQSAYLGLAVVDEQDDSLAAFLIAQKAVETSELLMVATAPAHRRLGYARLLIRSLLKRLAERGFARLLLDVAEDNRSAIGLYSSLGFAEDGRRPNYYKRNEQRVDALLMSRAITGLPPAKKA